MFWVYLRIWQYTTGANLVQFGLEIDEGLQVQTSAALMTVRIQRVPVIDAQRTQERYLQSESDTHAVFEIACVEIVDIEPQSAGVDEGVKACNFV